MSNDFVIVNGGRMAREFFEQNRVEAKSVQWEIFVPEKHEEHYHCIVCMSSLPNPCDERAYKAGSRHLCMHCFDQYLQ